MNTGALCVTYTDADGAWSMKVIDTNYDWQLVAEILNDFLKLIV